MRIYLAARFSRRDELKEYRAQLEALGAEVTSRWLDGKHELPRNFVLDSADGGQGADFAQFCAREDVEDVRSADTVIVFGDGDGTHPHPSRGGKHVEFGIALALEKRLIFVGPRDNVFNYLPSVEWFPDFDVVLRALLAD